MHIELQLIHLQIRIHLHGALQHALSQVSQPRDMLLLQIPQTPDIASLHQRQQMQGPHGLPIPVQVRQHEEPILGPVAAIPQNDVLLLRATLQNIKHPVQPALLALGAHVRPHVVAVDLRRLGDHADELLRVFLDVLLRAWPDEVEFEIGGSARPRA